MDSQSKSVKSFEELHVFQEGRRLIVDVWKLSGTAPFSKDNALVNQMRRAALSVVSNIAEGFERDSDVKFARYLDIAKGSCGEVRAQLLVAQDLQYISNDQASDLTSKTRKVSAGLSNLARYLRNTAQAKKKGTF